MQIRGHLVARLDPLEIERKPVKAASEIVVRGYLKNFGELGALSLGFCCRLVTLALYKLVFLYCWENLCMVFLELGMVKTSTSPILRNIVLCKFLFTYDLSFRSGYDIF